MNFSYPFHDTNNPYYESKKLWSALELSTAGGFSMGLNGFWHGGVHFESSAGISENQSIRAIADGEVIAYRLNEKYLIKDAETQDSKTFEYSTGFTLIRHNYQSLFGVDAQGNATQNRNELVFYSLYMHLKPYEEYDADELGALSYCEGETQYQVTEEAQDGPNNTGLNMRTAQNGSSVITQLPVGTKVKISQTQGDWGLVSEIVSGNDGYGGALGWIYLNNKETEKLSIPNQFDSVRMLSSSNEIKAGEPIGFMGKYDAPASATNTKKQLHLEVFTTANQAEITSFLSNQANVNLPETHDVFVIPQNTSVSNIYQAPPASENVAPPPPTFTESGETHYQNIIFKSTQLEGEAKTDASGNMWYPLNNISTHTSSNKETTTLSSGWVKTSGLDPSVWPGFDNPPLDAIADGVGYYKSTSPTALITTLIQKIEPSFKPGAETVDKQAYASAAKQVIAKGAVPSSIIKHKVEWSSAYTTDLMTVVTDEELIPDAQKKARFQERKEELDFWEEVTGMGTNEAYYFHPLAFIDNMMRMEAYYEAVIHVTNEIKTAIVMNADGTTVDTTQSWDYGAYNSLENGYALNNVVYSKKKSNSKSWFPTFKAYIYRGIGSEAKAKLVKDLENNNRNMAENDVLELARHTKVNNRNYDTGNPVPPTAANDYYEVNYRRSSTYRYRISTPKEGFPAAFPQVASNLELTSGIETIVARSGVNVERTTVSFDPWKSKDLEGCLGVMSGSGSYAIAMTGTSASKYINISEFLEGKVPELRGVYGRLYANQPSAVTEYDKHTRVWLKIESLPDVDHIRNGGQ